MPLTVAPPPRNGDAAQGRWSTDAPEPLAADPAGGPSGAPEPPPTLPAPAALARTMAAGVLLSAVALATAAALVLLIAGARLAFAPDVRLTFGGTAQGLIVAGLAIACAAALAAPLWPWPARRPATLALGTIVTAAWPLSGVAFGAALVAIAAVAVALVYDHRVAGGIRATSWMLSGLLALVAACVALAGTALADVRPEHPTAPRAAKPAAPAKQRSGAEKESRGAARVPGDSGKTPAKPPSAAATPTPTPTPMPPVRDETPGRTPAPPGHGATPGNGSTPRESPGGGTTPARGEREAPVVPVSETEASAADADEAEAFVRDFYTAIDEQRYDDAWAVLTPAVQSGFGGFARWKAGYAKTQSNTPNDLDTTMRGDRTIVRLRLSALEQGCPIARDYSVTWTLERPAGEWAVTGLRASADGASSCG